jgi:hypothetical protein
VRTSKKRRSAADAPHFLNAGMHEARRHPRWKVMHSSPSASRNGDEDGDVFEVTLPLRELERAAVALPIKEDMERVVDAARGVN